VYYRCTGYHGACGNTYIREERLATLLATVISPIQITPAIADDLVAALDATGAELEQRHLEAVSRLAHREQALIAKLDRGYEDYVSARISDAFWERKSQEWETELQEVRAERARMEPPRRPLVATAAHILELAKQAEFLYQTQDPREQRRLLETVLSNCSFDRGTLCPTYSSPFDLLVRGNETGDWRALQDSNLRPPGS
jgi:site-specific DNA recombinase